MLLIGFSEIMPDGRHLKVGKTDSWILKENSYYAQNGVNGVRIEDAL